MSHVVVPCSTDKIKLLDNTLGYITDARMIYYPELSAFRVGMNRDTNHVETSMILVRPFPGGRVHWEQMPSDEHGYPRKEEVDYARRMVQRLR